jgi:TDG/mug DNA glycosylase family protein
MARGKVPDVIAPGLRVLFCGINPGLWSARVRQHFARPGNRFWKTLQRAGFTETTWRPEEQRRLLEVGCGITNLVARETASAGELTTEELRAGGRALARKVRRYHPDWVAVLGVTAYRSAFDEPKAAVGRQVRRLGDAGLWVLPNPSGLNAHYQLDDLGRAFAELRREAVKEENRGAIRRYRPDDEAAVVGVWHRSGRAAYTYLPTWQAFTLEQARDVFRRTILGRCDLWVTEENGEVVGFLAMSASYIDRLYVDPSSQRRGWGRRLLLHARALSPRGLELHTHVENHPARTLYEQHGFVAVRYGVSPPPESAPDVEYHWRPKQV